MHSDDLLYQFLVSAVISDGYPVIEISTIGKLAAVRRSNPEAFALAAFGLPQTLIGVEKYMVLDRHKMNRYTETDNLFPYQDVDYQAKRTAAEMPQNFWNIAVLADRSSRLAPVQLQPYHPSKNPDGFRAEAARHPIDFIWGMRDQVKRSLPWGRVRSDDVSPHAREQMMPPSQMFRLVYAFPNAKVGHHEVADADHFVEIDNPHAVVRAMLGSLLREDKTAIPVFLGNGDYVMKGDESELKDELTRIYGAPQTRYTNDR